MGKETGIIWCHHTFNPWWGCTRVSPACTHCYAEAIATRFGHPVWGQQADRRFFGDAHWREPLAWDREAARAGERRRVFCSSMADVFEDRRDLDTERAKLWPLIERTKNLDWLLLSKRPENMVAMAPWKDEWPVNVWAGTTVENEEWGGKRIPHLLKVPAGVRFLSVEPILGPMTRSLDGIDWVITGGESGTHLTQEKNRERRIVDLVGGRWTLRESCAPWLRAIRDQCVSKGIAYFHKQNGGPTPHSGGRQLDGREWDEFPVHPRLTRQGNLLLV